MNHTSIEWVRNPDGSAGYTFNPITGCLNNCPYCYARKLANGRLKSRYIRNFEIALPHENPKLAFNDPFYPRFWPERLSDLHDKGFLAVDGSLVGKAKGIFVCDMSDLFGIGVPEEWTRKVLELVGRYSWHRFYLLTKQPQNLIKFSPFPDNCWVGVSVTVMAQLEKAMDYLYMVDAGIKFISFEPLLTQISCWNFSSQLYKTGLSWVIIGSQTKSYKPPKIEWVKEIVEACDKARIPVFLKDNLFPLISKIGNAKPLFTTVKENIEDKTHSVVLRQEMPNGK